MAYKVAKFGGTSLATREQVEKAIEIIASDEYRKFVVVSAPGKSSSSDTKMTDLLIACAREHRTNGSSQSLDRVKQKIEEIASGIPDLANRLSTEIEARLARTDLPNYEDCIKAFGEYASAVLITEIMKSRGLKAMCLDPKDIGFRITTANKTVQPDESSFKSIGQALLKKETKGKRPIIVIPGFYAYSQDGTLYTLPRGGSDTSGAVIANAIGASVYENWTDEEGLKRADPRIVSSPQPIKEITYREARELSYMGFKLQEDSLIPLIEKHIPLHVRNTNNPNSEGTVVVHERIVPETEHIAGVACKKGYISLNIAKISMNQQIGFGRKVFGILEAEKVSYEHAPTGIDNMSIILDRSQLVQTGKLNKIVREMDEHLGPLEIILGDPLALVSVVGLGIKSHHEVPGRALYALGKKSIGPRILNMGASEISFFIGVPETKAEDAVRTIYEEFYN